MKKIAIAILLSVSIHAIDIPELFLQMNGFFYGDNVEYFNAYRHTGGTLFGNSLDLYLTLSSFSCLELDNR